MRLVVASGIEKVNVGTEMNVQWVGNVQKTCAEGKVDDSVRKFLIPANNAVQEVLKQKFSCSNNSKPTQSHSCQLIWQLIKE